MALHGRTSSGSSRTSPRPSCSHQLHPALRASYADRVFTTSVVAYPSVPTSTKGATFPGDRKGAGAGRLRAGHPVARPERRLHGDHRFCLHRRSAAARRRDRRRCGPVSCGTSFWWAATAPGPAAATTPSLPRLTPPDTHPADPWPASKFRLNDLPLGTVPGTSLPASWTVGQCNDAYSAIRIVVGAGRRLWLRRQRPAPLAGAVV